MAQALLPVQVCAMLDRVHSEEWLCQKEGASGPPRKAGPTVGGRRDAETWPFRFTRGAKCVKKRSTRASQRYVSAVEVSGRSKVRPLHLDGTNFARHGIQACWE